MNGPPTLFPVGVDRPGTGHGMNRTGQDADQLVGPDSRVFGVAQHVFLGHDKSLRFRAVVSEPCQRIDGRRPGRPKLGKVRDLLISAQHHELDPRADQGLEDVVPVREHLPDGVVGLEHGRVAGMPADHGELARPGEFACKKGRS